jgi:hypothetical protein
MIYYEFNIININLIFLVYLLELSKNKKIMGILEVRNFVFINKK